MSTVSHFERARLARDARFDGRFFVAVRTTGIYCRPVCPAVTPKRENVEFFDTAAAAGEAGYRPCLRCRPECAPGSPAWRGTSTTVRRGLRLISEGALERDGVPALAERLGVTDRHLRRLFQQHVGASPQAIAHTQRLHFAKNLIDQTGLSMGDIAVAAGFGSTRRFNDAMRKTWGRTPRELRKLSKAGGKADALALSLPYHEPYDWQVLLEFFRLRALPGVESVDGATYRRVLEVDGTPVVAEVNDACGELEVRLHGATPALLMPAVQHLRDLFDVDAPIREIHAAFAGDPLLEVLVERYPAVRVPGSVNPFEHIVRAILGQQVSVRAATTLAGRIAERYGDGLPPELGLFDGLNRVFPRPERLVRARLENLGITSARAATIRRVASAVASRQLDVDPAGDREAFVDSMLAIRGIGDWTCQYVLMRAMKDPDAFPASDLGILKALGNGSTRPRPRDVSLRAEACRPWRAYAALLLWRHAAEGD